MYSKLGKNASNAKSTFGKILTDGNKREFLKRDAAKMTETCPKLEKYRNTSEKDYYQKRDW